MAKKDRGEMKLIIETQYEGCPGVLIRGEGRMQKESYLIFLLQCVSGIVDIVDKQMPEEAATFRGGMLMMLSDMEGFNRLCGVKESVLFDATKKSHE